MDDKVFTVEIDGVKEKFRITDPSVDNFREAQKVYNTAFYDAIQSKAVLRTKLNDLLEEQGLWDAQKEIELTTLQKNILQYEEQLIAGGIKLSEAKQIALKLRQLRNDMTNLISERTQLDGNTAEGQADNARFNYLVSVCVVYNKDGKPYFSSLLDFLNRTSNPVAVIGSQKLASKMYGLDNHYEKDLVENEFLSRYGFVDKQLRLIDDKKRLVDEEGRLIDEDGRFIDSKGNYVDIEGKPVDKKGHYVIKAKPFLDDNDKPIKFKKIEKDVATEEKVTTEIEKVTTEV